MQFILFFVLGASSRLFLLKEKRTAVGNYNIILQQQILDEFLGEKSKSKFEQEHHEDEVRLFFEGKRRGEMSELKTKVDLRTTYSTIRQEVMFFS